MSPSARAPSKKTGSKKAANKKAADKKVSEAKAALKKAVPAKAAPKKVAPKKAAPKKAAAKKTASKKRYVERPDIRAMLLDAAEELISNEGYAAATARRVASLAGLKHQAVFYYFGSQDDLLLAVLRRAMESHRKRLSEALNSEKPVRRLWELAHDRESTRLGLEFMALANHNEVIRREIANNAEGLRSLEAEAVARDLQRRGIEPRISPRLVSILTSALARLLVQESMLGIHSGHEEAEALVLRSLANFEASGKGGPEVEPIVGALSSYD